MYKQSFQITKNSIICQHILQFNAGKYRFECNYYFKHPRMRIQIKKKYDR